MVYRPYDLVIVAEYAGLSRKGDVLPNATKQGLCLAAACVSSGTARELAWGNSETPGPGADSLHMAKLQYLWERYKVSPRVVRVISNNTIQEIRAISRLRPDAQKILVICDRAHARRYRRLVKHFYAGRSIVMLPFPAKWNEAHPSFWQRSWIRWQIMNLCYYALMLVLGTDKFISKFENKVHPIRKEV